MMVQKMRALARGYGQMVWLWVQPFKWRLGYLIIFISFLYFKDFHVQIQFHTGQAPELSVHSDGGGASFFSKNEIPEKAQNVKFENEKSKIVNPQQRSYVRRFAHVARAEMQQFGIPASITLAQGLLESQAGNSPLAKEANNHFGIKCFSKNCKKGHCKNFSDDSHKDFFKTYPSAWESFRAHSQFLQRERYRHLLDLPKTDYERWAVGLKKAGYATDPKYAEKLIRLIEHLELDKYDV